MSTIVAGLARLVRARPVLVLVTVALLTAGFAVGLPVIEQSSGNEGFAPDEPSVTAANLAQERFGSSSAFQVVVRAGADGDLVSPEGVAAVGALRAALTEGTGDLLVPASPQQPSVVSPLDPLFGAAEQQGVDLATLDADGLKAMYDQVLAVLPPEQVQQLAGLFPEGAEPTTTGASELLMVAFLDDAQLGADQEAQSASLTRIADAVGGAQLPDGVAAEPFSFALLFASTDAFQSEIGRLFALAGLIILVILAFVFFVRPRAGESWVAALRRTAADVALAVVVIGLSIVWTNGAAGLLGPGGAGLIGALSQVTQILPVLLIGLGVDYSIHLVNRYREELGAGSHVGAAAQRGISTVGVALLLATVTTAVGFLTNLATPVPAIRDFGILAAIGITAAFLLTLTVVPAVRVLLDRRGEAAERLPRASLRSGGERALPGLAARAAVLAERAALPTVIVAFVLGGALGAYGLTNLSTSFSATDFVPDDSPLLATFQTLQDDFGGGVGETTSIVVTGDVATPAAHNALVASLDNLAAVEDVDTVQGRAAAQSPVAVLAGVLMPAGEGAAPTDPALAQQLLADGLQSDGTVAEDGDVAAIYATLAEAAPDQMQQVVAFADPESPVEPEVVQVVVRTSAGESGAAALADDMQRALAPFEGTGATATPTSQQIITADVTGALQASQGTSLVVSVVAAMLLLVLVYGLERRRPLLGVITIAPVALIVLWTFATMAATGIPFGPVTATIAALAVGIGVPYTIHVTQRFLEDRRTEGAGAIRATVRHTGGSLIGSAFTTIAGFGVLVTSSLTPFRQFGLVTVYAIGFALVASVLVLPSMLVLWDRWHRGRGEDPAAPMDRADAERKAIGV